MSLYIVPSSPSFQSALTAYWSLYFLFCGQGFVCLQGGVCLSSMGRPVSYERAVAWKVLTEEDNAHCICFMFINWSFVWNLNIGFRKERKWKETRLVHSFLFFWYGERPWNAWILCLSVKQSYTKASVAPSFCHPTLYFAFSFIYEYLGHCLSLYIIYSPLFSFRMSHHHFVYIKTR